MTEAALGNTLLMAAQCLLGMGDAEAADKACSDALVAFDGMCQRHGYAGADAVMGKLGVGTDMQALMDLMVADGELALAVRGRAPGLSGASRRAPGLRLPDAWQ